MAGLRPERGEGNLGPVAAVVRRPELQGSGLAGGFCVPRGQFLVGGLLLES